MAVLDLQRKGQQIGRIRLGMQVPVMRDGKDTGKKRPDKLTTFRFTTPSRHAADAIAVLYGGEVREWERQWEVVTDKAVIGVTVPPRDQVISQWYEMWNKGGAVRRCNSQTEQLSGKPCLCPHAEDPDDQQATENAAMRRAELAKLNPPQACKLVTRISVMIPDLPGLGIFRVDTGSYYAAVEIGDSAELMQMARDKGVFLPAMLRIEQRSRVAGGKTTNYPVPVLEVLTTFRDIVSGAIENQGLAAALPPAPGEQPKALTAGPAAAAPAPAATPPPDAPMTAQQFADVAPLATTQEEVNVLVEQAREARVLEDQVCTLADDGQETWEELVEVLRDRYRKVSPAAKAPAGDGK